ncbi:MAG: LacI family DNA-binding transcriptional regulator [Bacillaceae bacterium]|nr:LacI family DNA-binding transcriptional regulator [Bacillaceae bacterium]
MTTIKDVAKLAGVAVSTASYALNGKQKISEETRRKVFEAAKKLNYQKNGFASDLKSKSTKTIALILSDLSGPYYSQLIQGVQDVSYENGYNLVACSSFGGYNSTAVKFLMEKRVDGTIVFAHNIENDLLVQAAHESFPIIALDRSIESDHIVSIEVDNEQGGYLATKHLVELGHKHIAYVSGPVTTHDNILRFKGYQRALKEHNLPYKSKWNISGNFTREGGYNAAKLLISQKDLPSAVFFANDEMALGGLRAFKEKGIEVPKDISVIGFDDIQLAEYTRPSLTTIRQPKYEMGALAAHILYQLLKGEETENFYKLSTELIIRESTKILT